MNGVSRIQPALQDLEKFKTKDKTVLTENKAYSDNISALSFTFIMLQQLGYETQPRKKQQQQKTKPETFDCKCVLRIFWASVGATSAQTT